MDMDLIGGDGPDDSSSQPADTPSHSSRAQKQRAADDQVKRNISAVSYADISTCQKPAAIRALNDALCRYCNCEEHDAQQHAADIEHAVAERHAGDSQYHATISRILQNIAIHNVTSEVMVSFLAGHVTAANLVEATGWNLAPEETKLAFARRRKHTRDVDVANSKKIEGIIQGVQCRKCGKFMVTGRLEQRSRGDEPANMFYRCTARSCLYEWNAGRS